MTRNGRVARLTALALATGTLVAAGAGTASAATDTKDVYTATGGGSVLHLELNLPAAVGPLPSTITQDLVMTGSNAVTSSFTAPAAALTRSVLGDNGNVPVVSAALAKSLTAEYGKANPAAIGTFPANPLISGGVLQLAAETANPDVAGTFAHSLSSVTDVTVNGTADLSAVLDAVNAQLTTVLDGVIGTLPTGAEAAPVAGVTTTITDLLGSLSPQLQAAADATGDDAIQTAVAAVVAELENLPELLAGALNAKTADASLLSIDLIQSEQTLSRTADVVTSHATNKLAGISALGGLVTVEGMSSDATAALGTGAAAPTAKGTSSVLKVNVANLLGIDVTGDLKAALEGDAVPADVKNAVNGALATITSTLQAALGATLTGPQAKPSVATADKASAAVDAAHLRIQPVGFAKPLVDLALVPATAEVTRVKDLAVTQTVINPATEENLPRTGANLPLTGAAATALIGLALVARRRRQAGEIG